MRNDSKQMKLMSLMMVTLLSAAGVWADGGADHRIAQTGGDIELGTSGGNINDSSRRFCCSGTLGALVHDSSNPPVQYILSNNHILARLNQASLQEGVSHPGMIDQNCGTSDVIAALSDFVPILLGSRKNPGGPNEVDAAIAVVTGNVASDGSILDIGPVSSSTAAAFVGQAVQKSGRTTGHTTGSVSATNVVVNIGYSSVCGGRTDSYGTFVNQIMISGGSFSSGGDSGSLIVEDVASCGVLPKAVGLLFAGSSTSTVANPIDAVLFQLGVSMVGGSPIACPATGSISGTVTDGASAIEGATVTVLGSGQTGTTNAIGHYDIAGVEVGSQDVQASASGFVTSAAVAVSVLENQDTDGVDFALTAALNATEAIAKCVIYQTQGGKNKDRNLNIKVQVVNDFDEPVSGASVSVIVTLYGGAFGSATGTTDETGEARFVARNAPDGDYVTTVQDIVSGSLTYAGPLSTPEGTFTKTSGQQQSEWFCQPGASPSGSAAPSGGSARNAASVKAQYSAWLLTIPGVVGHGVGRSDSGESVIEVYLETGASRARVPASLENVPVRVVVTGSFVAY